MRTPTTTLLRLHERLDVGDLAIAVEHDGLAAHEPALRSLVDAARLAGLSPVLIGLLADPNEPDVARLRAFGLLAARLAASGPSGDTDHHATTPAAVAA